MFLSDVANFATPLSKWGQRIANAGNTRVGKVFMKDAQKITREIPGVLDPVVKHGIAGSGKTLRRYPFALAGLGVAGYGAYRAKKTYDKYKPEIKTARKAMKVYNNFKNRFNIGEDK